MTYYIDIQNASEKELPLREEQLTELACLALRDHTTSAELTIRLVTQAEMIFLNTTYRKINKTTNVLAFPCLLPEEIELECPLLGDVIICPAVVAEESVQAKKSLQEYWSHIVIHGVLHLLGFDHIEEKDALIMQEMEVTLLAELGYQNPYDIEE